MADGYGKVLLMNILHLKYFVVAGECLNFSEAAKKLFITQPNLSHVISSLEKQLGAKLFIRSTKFVKLAPAGELLMSAAVEIIEKYDRVLKEIEEHSAMNKETLRIGYMGTVFNRIFPTCIPKFQSINPNVKITLQRFDPNYFLGAFDYDLIDLGFSHKTDVETIKSLNSKSLFDVFLAVVAHEDHPLSTHDCVDLITLKNEQLIVPQESFSPFLHKKIMDVCARRGFIPHISQRAQSIDVYFQMIDSKMGVALLPETCKYLNYPNIKIIRIRDNEDLNVGACFVWKHKLKPLALKLLELVEDVISKSPED